MQTVHPTRRRVAALAVAGLAGLAALPLAATTGLSPAGATGAGPPLPWFNKVATYETSGGGAEIVAGISTGNRVFYTDAGAEEVGAVDITDPSNPTELYTVPVVGEPTSVAVTPNGATAAAVVNDDPNSTLVAFDAATGAVLRTMPLHGQPDSIAIAPSGNYAAIAIENEESPGVPGELAIVNLKGSSNPASWVGPLYVPMTGLADLNPGDPEPEFIDINGAIAAVTLQENNHVVLVDLKNRVVVNDFSAGTTTQAADLTEEKEISFAQTLTNAPLMPDGIAYDPKTGFLVTADEGEADLTGGRGFSVFRADGFRRHHETEFELMASQHGHYPDGRSANKGVEAENVELGRFNKRTAIFVASERGAFLAVYEMTTSGVPTFRQLLPTGVEPEGVLALPGRGLVMTADEASGTLSIFQAGAFPPAYPDVVSEEVAGVPLPWSALSGLAEGGTSGQAFGVADSAFLQSRIYEFDASADPLVVTDVIGLVDGGGNVNADLEGITTRLDGSGNPDPSLGWWVASEGNAGALEDRLMAVNAAGTVTQSVELPDPVDAQDIRWGFEGVAVTGSGASEQVYVAFQREWLDDPAGFARIGRYTPSTGAWAFYHYPMDVPSPNSTALLTGLSELVAIDDTTFAVIERDSLSGSNAAEKLVYTFSIAGVTPTPCADIDPTCPVLASSEVTGKTLLSDLLADFGFDREKIEGLYHDGSQWVVVNDNDGFGETRVVRF